MAKTTIPSIESLIASYRVTSGKRFRLSDFDPGDTHGFASEDKFEAKEILQRSIAWLAEQQDVLYAQNRWAVLIIFQAMDAAGKDSTIKHVMSGINPQGCEVTAFKQPFSEELDHDYLWRHMRHVSERGRIGIFNRSYYEEVLVVRVHQELLQRQQLPLAFVTKRIWRERYEEIASLERYLTRNGIVVLKFFLHVSKAEQKRRFLARLDEPEKNWKFSAVDVAERAHWDQYQNAYEHAIRHTATRDAPWYVVPADNKWFTRLVVGATIVETLAGLDLHYPKVDAAKRKELARARRQLLKEK